MINLLYLSIKIRALRNKKGLSIDWMTMNNFCNNKKHAINLPKICPKIRPIGLNDEK